MKEFSMNSLPAPHKRPAARPAPSDGSLDLLDTADIAAILGVSRQYITDHLSKLPKFPAPVINLSQKLRRWDRAEVMAYFTARAKR